MSYTPIDFKNLPITSTPLSAANMNHVQTQYESAISDLTPDIQSVAGGVSEVSQNLLDLSARVDALGSGTGAPFIRIQRGTYLGASYHLSTIDTSGQVVPGVLGKEFGEGYAPVAGAPESDLKPPREHPVLASKRVGAGLIVNMSGWRTSGNVGELRGAQIKDGVAYHDLNLLDWQDSEAVGVTYQGELRFYSARRGDTAAKMVSEGVKDSWSFGPILREEGVNTDMNDPFWSVFSDGISGRQIIGVLSSGNIAILTVQGTSGASGLLGRDAQALVEMLGFRSAINMDGGGSTQALSQGTLFHASSDAGGTRGIPDFLYVNAPVLVSPPPAAIPLNLSAGVVSNGPLFTPTLTYDRGVVRVAGAVKGTSAGIPATLTTASVLPEPFRPATELVGSSRGNGSTMRKVVVATDGLGIYFPAAVAGDVGNYNFLSGLSWNTPV